MELDTILNIMAKYKLTADELLLVYLTFIAQTENGDPKIKYFKNNILLYCDIFCHKYIDKFYKILKKED